jgi:hypothetical protein
MEVMWGESLDRPDFGGFRAGKNKPSSGRGRL